MQKIIARAHEWLKAGRAEDGLGKAWTVETVNNAQLENGKPTRPDAVRFGILPASNTAAGSARLINPD